MELEIECLWHTDKTRQDELAGLDVDPTECELMTITFYNVEAIYPNTGWKDGIERCSILIAGDKFISAYSYKETKEMIAKSKKIP